GQLTVPVIFSSDFLELYNVFAPAQGLPQLSPKTISSVNIILECSGPHGSQNFKGNIVALTDRISSVLVPKTFMNWSNINLGGDTSMSPSRVYLKTKDANNPQLISYLDSQNYHLNKDKIKFSRIKGILQNIVGVLGIFGVLVIALALLLFSFYLQLMIAKSKANLQLLLTLGYSPKWLAQSVSKTWLPIYLSIMVVSLIIAQIGQLLFLQLSFAQKANLSWMLHWSVWLTAGLLFVITMLTTSRLVKNELNKL
ncbi:MAG: FtsX-like permease family protein, partial [Ginsengibacter sp.]